MSEREDWSAATWEGSRRRQHRDFRQLPFAQKLALIEDLADLADLFAARRRARDLPVSGARPRRSGPGTQAGEPG